MHFKWALVALLLPLGRLSQAQTRPPQSNPDSLRVVWADVDHFWRAYDQLRTAATRPDSLRIVQEQYLARATPGLRRYAEAANATAADFVRAIGTHRQYLAASRAATQAIGQQRPALLRAARELKKMYPAATFPDVYFAIGKFEVGGSQFENLLYVGAELKCAGPHPPLAELRPELRGGVSPVAALSTAVIHEIIHSQQPQNARTNLELALREGAAEYLAFRLTGRLGSPEALAYGRRHEAAVRQQFAPAAGQPVAARWFLAAADPATGQPGALAYFIGFRICETYYATAPDKQVALQNLVSLADLPGLLACGQHYLVGKVGR